MPIFKFAVVLIYGMGTPGLPQKAIFSTSKETTTSYTF